MRAVKRAVPCLLAGLGLGLMAGGASGEEGPPKLDIEKTCNSPGRTQIQVQASKEESLEGCLRSERGAHDELKKRWGEFSETAKAQCSKQSEAGGFPSYVETVTCLELATGAVPAQTGSDKSSEGPGAPKGATTGKKKDSEITAEPPASQRTNPIDILNKQ